MVGTADKDYFLDKNGNVTTDEEKAATLLVRKGQDISKEMADKYDIGKAKSSASEDAAEKAKAPAANKSEKPAKNK